MILCLSNIFMPYLVMNCSKTCKNVNSSDYFFILKAIPNFDN